MMDFAIFAITFNIEEMHRKTLIINKKPQNHQNRMIFLPLFYFLFSLQRKLLSFQQLNARIKKIAA
jgi:hypothetical protein